MNDKFKVVPVDPDTRVFRRSVTSIGGYDALHEKWSFEGVKAESFVFLSADVAGVSDETLEKLVRETEGVATNCRITLKRSESGFTFVNFNFQY